MTAPSLAPTLPDRLARRAVLPGDRRYAALRSTYTTVHSPAVILLPQDDDEVAEALRYAAGTGLVVSVRSGGHGLSGRSSNDGGIVVDLSAMSVVEVLDRDAGRVRVQAGARWAEVARELSPHGLAISSGDHGNVGVGGLATAGGVGWLARSYGLTVDHVLAATVVAPDGTVVKVDAAHEPELFWAVRGAGDSVGIVTELEIEAVHLGAVGVGQVLVEADREGTTLRRWSEYLSQAPYEVTTAGMLLPDGGRFVLQLTVVVASDDPDLVRDLVSPLAEVGTRALAVQASMSPYEGLVPTGHLHPNMGQQPSNTTNALLPTLDDDAARALMDVAANPAGALVQLRSVGGRVNDVDPHETAYVHRHQEVLAVVSTFPPDDGRRLDDAFSPLLVHRDGSYRNFESRPDEASFDRAFPGVVGDRIRRVRSRQDPHGVLRRTTSR